MTIETAIEAVRKVLGPRLETTEAARSLHGQNEGYYPVTPPDAVASPETTQEVSEILRICNTEGCPVVAWGTGTSLEANALALRGGICLDMSRMDKVLDTQPEDMLAVVQPGVTREALNEELRATGLFFPVDPGANASLGGMASTRASGTTAVRYGTMRENVMALEAVLADGRIIRTGSRARKSASGYDLTKLLIGSEGTLGIITELTLRLQGQPEAISAAVCAFPDVASAVDTVITTIQMGVPMARIELLDAVQIKGLNQHFNATMEEVPQLFLEFHGSDSAVKEQAEIVAEIAADHGGKGFEWSTRPEDRSRLWKMRHNAYFAAKALRPGCRVVTTDICVPISKLAQAIADTQADMAGSTVKGPILGHVGDGNYHTALLVDPDNPAELEEAKSLAARMAKRALAVGGTVTGEHGIGVGKMKFMAEEHGQGWSVMADIKRTFDPRNILNPGKVVEIN
ncbi:FAD-binding oxidoreductase [Algicella marina]|uniref:D-lactate dehydrogenase (cytochrome) n=1 Tax=Algicella marina TaxID=2683284 RepID=A0A6P1SX53_9RHOB|nr:FAD-linked oxidase C-terminal domain-containing protein [Algicella marina]QHQ34061.1 FAD-binding protein [Algicella marina]